MAKRRRRRKWADDEKRMICAQARMPGVSVAQVARRYDVNANQIFNWMKDPKFATDDASLEDEARFLPVEIVSEPAPAAPSADASGVIELELVGGHRLRISGGYDPEAVARLAHLLA
ncbi:MAG: transposase [Paracoccaceae bacterium]